MGAPESTQLLGSDPHLIAQLDINLRFRWLVGPVTNAPAEHYTVFTGHR
jgi:hypothetical protein